MTNSYPSVFVGSSVEGLDVAEAIQVALDYACEVTVWSQGVFGLGEGNLEALVNRLDEFDFAILVLTADDLTASRGTTRQSPRDNVLLELGLFIGRLGRERTFAVHDRTSDIKLPSDLAGVTMASYRPHKSGDVQASLGAACTQIKRAIESQGIRTDKSGNSSVPKSKVSADKESKPESAQNSGNASASSLEGIPGSSNEVGPILVVRCTTDGTFTVESASCRIVSRSSIYSTAGYSISLRNEASVPTLCQISLQFMDETGLGVDRKGDEPIGEMQPGEMTSLGGNIDHIVNAKADQFSRVAIDVRQRN